MMNRKMFKSIRNCFSFMAAIAIAVTLSQTTLAQQDKASVYKINEAGIQFTVAAGWEVEKGEERHRHGFQKRD